MNKYYFKPIKMLKEIEREIRAKVDEEWDWFRLVATYCDKVPSEEYLLQLFEKKFLPDEMKFEEMTLKSIEKGVQTKNSSDHFFKKPQNVQKGKDTGNSPLKKPKLDDSKEKIEIDSIIEDDIELFSNTVSHQKILLQLEDQILKTQDEDQVLNNQEKNEIYIDPIINFLLFMDLGFEWEDIIKIMKQKVKKIGREFDYELIEKDIKSQFPNEYALYEQKMRVKKFYQNQTSSIKVVNTKPTIVKDKEGILISKIENFKPKEFDSPKIFSPPTDSFDTSTLSSANDLNGKLVTFKKVVNQGNEPVYIINAKDSNAKFAKSIFLSIPKDIQLQNYLKINVGSIKLTTITELERYGFENSDQPKKVYFCFKK